MKSKFAKAFSLMAVVMFMAFSFNASAADDKPMTPEFCEEGITKAVAALDEMVEKINEIEREEQLQALQQITNSIKMRNVRKKYGKIELTDEYRVRLVDANMRVGKALNDMIVRMRLPYELQKALEEHASEEKVREEIAKCKTLRQAME